MNFICIQIKNEESTDVLITKKANVTKENIKFHTTDGYSIYALYKSQQTASGIISCSKSHSHIKIPYK